MTGAGYTITGASDWPMFAWLAGIGFAVFHTVLLTLISIIWRDLRHTLGELRVWITQHPQLCGKDRRQEHDEHVEVLKEMEARFAAAIGVCHSEREKAIATVWNGIRDTQTSLADCQKECCPRGVGRRVVQ